MIFYGIYSIFTVFTVIIWYSRYFYCIYGIFTVFSPLFSPYFHSLFQPIFPLSLSKKNITDKGRLTACQAVARLAITTNPVMAFPGQQTYEAIRSQLYLLKQEQRVDRSSLMNFEALMALTNLASIDDGHRNKIVTTPEMIYCIESLALENHDMLRRAAVQLMCNLLMCQKYRDLFKEAKEEATSCDRLN